MFTWCSLELPYLPESAVVELLTSVSCLRILGRDAVDAMPRDE